MINLYKLQISRLSKLPSIKRLVKYLNNRDDISVYEYFVLATLVVVGVTVSIIEYLL